MRRTGAKSLLFMICLSVFVMMLGAGLANPILPLFARSFGVSYTLVGFVVGGYGLARVFTELPAGSWADRFGRRPLINIGLLLFSLSGIIAYCAEDVMTLFVARLVQGIGTALYLTPSLAILSDICPRDERGKYASLYLGSDYLGYAIGPVIGGYVSERAGFKSAFLMLALLSGIVFILAFAMIRETAIPIASSHQLGLRNLGKNIDARLVFVGWTAVIFNFIASGIRSTAVPLIGEIRGLTPSQIGLILTAAAFVNAFALVIGRGLVDKWGRMKVLSVTFASTSIVAMLFPFASDFVGLTLMTTLISLTTILMAPVQSAIVMDIAHPEHIAYSFGVFHMLGDLGLLAGPALVGYLSDIYGFSASFHAVAFICTATLSVMIMSHATGHRSRLD